MWNGIFFNLKLLWSTFAHPFKVSHFLEQTQTTFANFWELFMQIYAEKINGKYVSRERALSFERENV